MKLYVVACATGLAMLVASSGHARDGKTPPEKKEQTKSTPTEESKATGTTNPEEKAPDQVEVTNANRVLEARVYFEFDKFNLDDDAKASLQQASKWLEGNDATLILIEGHTDKMGDDAYNKKLGDARAQASREYLVSLGVDPSRIKVISYGEQVPVVQTQAPEAKNRRIVIYAVDKKPIVETKVVQVPCPSPEPEARVPVRGEEPPAPDVVPVEEKKHDAVDFGILGGAGVMGMIDGPSRALTHPGGSWNVRASLNTKYVVGFEASYVGSAQDLQDEAGLAGHALVGNGVEGDVRLNILPGRFRPYVFGGGGWMHYNVTNTPGGDHDTVITVPAGAGMDVRFARDYDDPGLVVDVRGTVRPAFEEDIFKPVTTASGDSDADLDSWSVTAQAGYDF